MSDKEIIDFVIAEYKAVSRKQKGIIPACIKDAVCNYSKGRTNGMSVKTLVSLADFVGLEINVQKKQDNN